MRRNPVGLFLAALTLLGVHRGLGHDFSSDGNDGGFDVHVSEAQLEKSPRWKPEADNPPLASGKALKLANAVKDRLVKDDDRGTWHLEYLRLTPVDERNERWLWLVCYRKQLRTDITGRGAFFRLVVLMDGTVPEPIPTKK